MGHLKRLFIVMAIVFPGCILLHYIHILYGHEKHHQLKTTDMSTDAGQEKHHQLEAADHVPQEITPLNTSDRGHVVLTFPVYPRNKTTNQTENDKRMMEYKHCLTKFFSNDFVKQVHVMYDSSDMPTFIQDNIGSHPKLNLHQVKSPEVALTLHQFAFTHLQGEVVIITQADIILGEGVERINKDILIKHNLMYSLSRYESPCGKMNNMCRNYIGSHDTFVFVPQGNISTEARSLLSHTVSSWHTENVVMYVYANLLNYDVVNPCLVIKIYHFHCSSFRFHVKQRKFVGKGGHRAFRRSTYKLV